MANLLGLGEFRLECPSRWFTTIIEQSTNQFERVAVLCCRVILLAFIWTCCWLPAQAERRVALVVEQKIYDGNLSDIELASEEAELVASALEQSGFEVGRVRNLTSQGLQDAVSDFRTLVKSSSTEQTIAFLYYTGHGANDPTQHESYLLGTDAEIHTIDDLDRAGLRISSIRDAFDSLGAKAVVLVFDACRDDGSLASVASGPKGMQRVDFDAQGVDARGLEIVEAQNDMLIAYSTGVGDIAIEGNFAPELAEALVRPYQSIETAFAWTQRRVAQRTFGGQKPWTNNLLYGEELCLVSCAPAYLVSAGEQAGISADQAKSILASFGFTNIPFEDWPEKLLESAERLKSLETKLSGEEGEGQTGALLAEARTAVSIADFARADELLAEAAKQDLAAGYSRLQSAAEAIEQRAELAEIESRFVDAANLYSEAAKLMFAVDQAEWARLKYNQGTFLYEAGRYSAERGLLIEAVSTYRDTLRVYSYEQTPLDWAMVQNNLGVTLAELGERGDQSAFVEAFRAFREALKVYNRSRPSDWAETQVNIGNILLALYERGNDKALEPSIEAYRKALSVQRQKYEPLAWASTQSNLGNALVALGEQGNEAALDEAVQCFRAALREYRRKRVPLDWAMTQNNLGNALSALGENGDQEAQNEAVTSYREALKEYTREKAPLDWAMVQNNLGAVLFALGERDDSLALTQAVAAYREALKELTRDRNPSDWAMTQYNLGLALAAMDEEKGGATLEEAIVAFRLALSERTRERDPVKWALTQYNLGIAILAFEEQGIRSGGSEAVDALSGALGVFASEQMQVEYDRAMLALRRAQQIPGTLPAEVR